MIERIGVILQDAHSLGFLKGLKKRLGCNAEFILPPTPVGKPQYMTRKQARIACAYFQKKAVDLVLRFTDADAARWQDVQRREINVFPSESHAMLICGVAVDNPEAWIALDPSYLCEALGIQAAELRDASHRTERVKAALRKARADHEGASEVVARIVAEAPTEVFRRWLRNAAFRRFYEDCRAAALRADCDVTNELRQAS